MAFILLIEDKPGLRHGIARMLRAEGHDVSEACDGREGLELLRWQNPEMVLTEIIMPAIDGVEIMAANRALPRPAKVIAMSDVPARGGYDYLAVAKTLGADATLRKPFGYKELNAVIAQCGVASVAIAP